MRASPIQAVALAFNEAEAAAADSDDPDAERQKLVDEYNETYANPFIAAERGYIDDVFEPRDAFDWRGLGEIDRILIRALYDPRLKIGMSNGEAIAVASTIFDELLSERSDRDHTKPRGE